MPQKPLHDQGCSRNRRTNRRSPRGYALQILHLNDCHNTISNFTTCAGIALRSGFREQILAQCSPDSSPPDGPLKTDCDISQTYSETTPRTIPGEQSGCRAPNSGGLDQHLADIRPMLTNLGSDRPGPNLAICLNTWQKLAAGPRNPTMFLGVMFEHCRNTFASCVRRRVRRRVFLASIARNTRRAPWEIHSAYVAHFGQLCWPLCENDTRIVAESSFRDIWSRLGSSVWGQGGWEGLPRNFPLRGGMGGAVSTELAACSTKFRARLVPFRMHPMSFGFRSHAGGEFWVSVGCLWGVCRGSLLELASPGGPICRHDPRRGPICRRRGRLSLALSRFQLFRIRSTSQSY